MLNLPRYSCRKDVDQLNNLKLMELEGDKIAFTCTDTGKFGEFQDLLEKRAPKELILGLGAQVMLTKASSHYKILYY